MTATDELLQDIREKNRRRYIILFSLMLPLSVFFRAWVAMRIYNWFAPPNWPDLGYQVFVGMVCIGMMVVPSTSSPPNPDLNFRPSTYTVSIFIPPFFTLMFASVIAFIYHWVW